MHLRGALGQCCPFMTSQALPIPAAITHLQALSITLPSEAPLCGLLVGFAWRDVQALPVAREEAVCL